MKYEHHKKAWFLPVQWTQFLRGQLIGSERFAPCIVDDWRCSPVIADIHHGVWHTRISCADEHAECTVTDLAHTFLVQLRLNAPSAAEQKAAHVWSLYLVRPATPVEKKTARKSLSHRNPRSGDVKWRGRKRNRKLSSHRRKFCETTKLLLETDLHFCALYVTRLSGTVNSSIRMYHQ